MSTPRPRLSVLVPSYNTPELLKTSLESLLSQGVQDMEIIVSDDASPTDMRHLESEISDPRVKWCWHKDNVGYGGNLNRAYEESSGDLIMLMAQDDIFLPGALARTIAPFDDPEVTTVTRPYYWFFGDPAKPIRAVFPLKPGEDVTVTVDSDQHSLNEVFWSIAQLSGLVYRRSALRMPFHEDIFTAHVWPFLDAMKRGRCVVLGDYTVAVRTESSMTRHLPVVYAKSPLVSWIECFEGAFHDVPAGRAAGRRYLSSRNFGGLIQTRNYGTFGQVIRELVQYVRYAPAVLGRPDFLLFAAVALLLPPRLLIPLTDKFKKHVWGFLISRRVSAESLLNREPAPRRNMISSVAEEVYTSELFQKAVPTLPSMLRAELSGMTTVLDLGCGEDSPVPRATLAAVIGVDGYEPSVNAAREAGAHAEVILANVLDLDFPPRSFDAVVLVEVIEHLESEDAMKLIERAKDWARVKVVLTTPNGFFPQGPLYGNEMQRHVSGWTPRDLQDQGFVCRGLAGHKALRQKHNEELPAEVTPFAATLRAPWQLSLIAATLTQIYTSRRPDAAFELFAVWSRVGESC